MIESITNSLDALEEIIFGMNGPIQASHCRLECFNAENRGLKQWGMGMQVAIGSTATQYGMVMEQLMMANSTIAARDIEQDQINRGIAEREAHLNAMNLFLVSRYGTANKNMDDLEDTSAEMERVLGALAARIEAMMVAPKPQAPPKKEIRQLKESLRVQREQADIDYDRISGLWRDEQDKNKDLQEQLSHAESINSELHDAFTKTDADFDELRKELALVDQDKDKLIKQNKALERENDKLSQLNKATEKKQAAADKRLAALEKENQRLAEIEKKHYILQGVCNSHSANLHKVGMISDAQQKVIEGQKGQIGEYIEEIKRLQAEAGEHKLEAVALRKEIRHLNRVPKAIVMPCASACMLEVLTCSLFAAVYGAG